MRKLYRSKTDRIGAGICGGVAAYIKTDPAAVRLLFSILCIATAIFPLLLLYVIAGALIPEDPSGAQDSSRRYLFRSKKDYVLAGICSAMGKRFHIDPSILRLSAIALGMLTGFLPLGILYGIGWSLIPVEAHEKSAFSKTP